eukprot:CAMPEP_0184490368 /NCGR_PEP_ID=MMETSP0113_2-20130426/17720_1 /TAXON_ID=91329 /ORGANISM="Norrisiella sphaerica, Strain BC52" /LENGTH=439 /DNA_ID=CAMNT_0026874223 /DNA_START=27 /DNA_END=1346 /DNA_ORIENTATION=+
MASLLAHVASGATALYALSKLLNKKEKSRGVASAWTNEPVEGAIRMLKRHLLDQNLTTDSKAIAATAPGRVNLIGEHVDYNMGFVMPIAINKFTAFVGVKAKSDDSAFEIAIPDYEKGGDSVKLYSWSREDFFKNERPVCWHHYVRGVAALLERRGIKVPAFKAAIVGNVPQGGGLSSSASLEVATATFLENLCKTQLAPIEKAKLCQEVEHKWCDVPCGIMDQFASVFGQEKTAMLIDCKSLTMEAVPIRDSSVAFLIVNSNVKHALVDGAYKKRKAACDAVCAKFDICSLRELSSDTLENEWKSKGLTETELRRARHVVTEIERTSKAAICLKNNEYKKMGKLMNESHASLRDLYEVSCKELDVLVGAAQASEGVYGARMTGAGFGGSIVVLIRSDQLDAIQNNIQAEYAQKVPGITPTFLSSPAAEGAAAEWVNLA